MKAQELLVQDAPWVPIAYGKPPLSFPRRTSPGYQGEPRQAAGVQHRLAWRPVGERVSRQERFPGSGGVRRAQDLADHPVPSGVSIVVFFMVRAIPGDPA